MSATPRETALAALEWGKIAARLTGHAASGPGRDLCAALSPGVDLDAIRTSLEENRDGRRVLLHEGPLPLTGVQDKCLSDKGNHQRAALYELVGGESIQCGSSTHPLQVCI